MFSQGYNCFPSNQIRNFFGLLLMASLCSYTTKVTPSCVKSVNRMFRQPGRILRDGSVIWAVSYFSGYYLGAGTSEQVG